MTSRGFHFLLVLLAGCAGPALRVQLGPSELLLGAPGCSQATPGDDLDDLGAIQAAINARCCLGPGTYDVDTPAAPPGGRRPYAMLTVPLDAVLCGAGPTTVIRFRGSAGGQDWRGIQLAGGGIHDVLLDTSQLVGTSEQTHAIHVRGPATGLIDRVSIHHPERIAGGVTLPGGDCIDVVGYAPAELVVGLVIRDSQFLACDRGGIQVHGGTLNLTVTGNEFHRTGNLDLNSEGSGGSSHWIIAGNRFRASDGNHSEYAIALDLVDTVSVVDNQIERGVYLYSCTHCSLVKNAITMTGGSAVETGTIEAIKGSNDLVIEENVIRRPATQDFGPLLHVGPHGTAQSVGVRVIHNELIQETTSDMIYAEGVADLAIVDNALEYRAAATGAAGVRLLGSATYGTSKVALVGNTFAGPLRSAVMTGGSGERQGIGSLLSAWNIAEAPGLACVNTSGIQGPLLLIYNSWPAAICGSPPIPLMLP
jgi:hypothetical protein